MFYKTKRQLNRKQIEAHLKSAVAGLTPDVLDKIDFSAPQLTAEEAGREEAVRPSVTSIGLHRRRLRAAAALAAACLCVIALAGGMYTYRNGKVDSVIGIDVNPSVELSVNRKNQVLQAVPLNDDAKAIMQDMDLKGVPLNVAVNAVIGSLVTHGYLDDLENAILVTVSNDSVKKASALRSEVVGDIQSSLKENQVKAVVYDQQVIEEADVKTFADQYGISYGKAYFLKELIDQNPDLDMTDMKELAPLTMEQIAKEITERSFEVGGHTGVSKESTAVAQTAKEPPATTADEQETTLPQESESAAETSTAAASIAPAVLPTRPEIPVMTTEEQTAQVQEPVSGDKIKIDYVDYENGVVTVHFITKVKWKNPTVSVKDGNGNAFSAMVGDTDSSACEIYVNGLDGGTAYTFILGGISPKNGRQTTVKGTFDTPVIGDGNADDSTAEKPVPPETAGSEVTPRPPKPTEAQPTQPVEATEPSAPVTPPSAATPPTEPPQPVQGQKQSASSTHPAGRIDSVQASSY